MIVSIIYKEADQSYEIMGPEQKIVYAFKAPYEQSSDWVAYEPNPPSEACSTLRRHTSEADALLDAVKAAVGRR